MLENGSPRGIIERQTAEDENEDDDENDKKNDDEDDETGYISFRLESLIKKYRFDHEKLDVYQLELQFVTWVTPY